MIVHSVSGTYVLKQSYYDLSVAQYHEITEIVKIGPSFLWTKKNITIFNIIVVGSNVLPKILDFVV